MEAKRNLRWSERLLGAQDIGIDDDFFEKGGNSMLATQMLLEVEQLTGKPYPQAAANAANTLAAVMAAIKPEWTSFTRRPFPW